jgi:hypothetical protein
MTALHQRSVGPTTVLSRSQPTGAGNSDHVGDDVATGPLSQVFAVVVSGSTVRCAKCARAMPAAEAGARTHRRQGLVVDRAARLLQRCGERPNPRRRNYHQL